jgi:Fe-S oxidoreductase
VLGKYAPYEKLQAVRDIVQAKEKPKNWEAVFLCTKCEACDELCPENIPVTKFIDLGRNYCVQKWGLQYSRQTNIIEKINKFGNPFGNQESRLAWLEEEVSERSDTLLHIGCMISYPLSSMGKSIIRILKKLKIDFTISPEERCCGYFVYNTGNHEEAQALISQNSEIFKQYSQIITACAGCYTFLKAHYSLNTPIKHVIEVIFEKLGTIKLGTPFSGKKAIFQDSCHIARPHGITEEPRMILKRIGLELIEFNSALCCGANGGMRNINPDIALEVGRMRLLEAKEKSDLLVTLCPFCIAHFRDAAQKFNIPIQINSLFEMLDQSLL